MIATLLFHTLLFEKALLGIENRDIEVTTSAYSGFMSAIKRKADITNVVDYFRY